MSKQYPWVTVDGIYDHREYSVRYNIVDGNAKTVISKMWLDKGGPASCTEAELKPWGTYPDFPAKPTVA